MRSCLLTVTIMMFAIAACPSASIDDAEETPDDAFTTDRSRSRPDSELTQDAREDVWDTTVPDVTDGRELDALDDPADNGTTTTDETSPADLEDVAEDSEADSGSDSVASDIPEDEAGTDTNIDLSDSSDTDVTDGRVSDTASDGDDSDGTLPLPGCTELPLSVELSVEGDLTDSAPTWSRPNYANCEIDTGETMHFVEHVFCNPGASSAFDFKIEVTSDDAGLTLGNCEAVLYRGNSVPPPESECIDSAFSETLGPTLANVTIGNEGYVTLVVSQFLSFDYGTYRIRVSRR